jgi:predicted HicB family RNase H-like nuclease
MPKSLERPEFVQLATRMPKRLHRAMKLECIAAGVTLEVWIRDALETYLARVARRPETRARAVHD